MPSLPRPPKPSGLTWARPSQQQKNSKEGEAGSEPELIEGPGVPGQPENQDEPTRGDGNGDADEAVNDDNDPGLPANDEADRGFDLDSDDGSYRPPPYVQEIPVVPGQAIRLVIASSDDGRPIPKKEHPQVRMNKFWYNFEPEYEGGITQILPQDAVSGSNTKKKPLIDSPTNATRSYQQAREQCIKSVKRIVRECHALNQRYTDIHFDLERDLRVTGDRDCLDGLGAPRVEQPEDVKRVIEIFEAPEFYKDGAGFDDVVQGYLGDCWFLAALSALTTNQEFVKKVCVIQDQEVGVYGFVFYRDGDWQPCIVDDKLYMRAPSYDESGDTTLGLYGVQQKDPERAHRKLFQTGSRSLYFAACRDENETWVPLLEKAFAKAHGDFYALSGGQTGEALEDLTGGVTTEIYTQNILSTDRFWTERLSQMGKEFIFSCAKALWVDDREVRSKEEENERDERRKGLMSGHAYAVLGTYEGYGKRLVKIRNPWGHREWNGPWSDGSKEWNAEWVKRLDHNFGDDGVFWISYEDMLQKYRYMDCTRIFGPEWHVIQEWARVQVPWSARDYQQTKFSIVVPTKTEVVIVLTQLDNRYFCGLEGTYNFSLQFRVQNEDEEDEDEYITRSKLNYELTRSTNVELELEPGNYTVLFKVEAKKTTRPDIESVIRENIHRRDKVTKMATLYDLAHAKGQPPKKEKPKEAKKGKSKESSPKDQKADGKEDTATKVDETNQTKDSTQLSTEDKPSTENEKPDQQSKPEESQKPKEIEKTPDEMDQVDKTEDEDTAKTDPEKPNIPIPDDNDPDRNPWNASCTVGLRVYSRLDDLELKVIWPEGDRPVALDRDDIAKSALQEAEAAADQKEDTKDPSDESDSD